jgi:peptide-methionine (S)-S-oxide reductase
MTAIWFHDAAQSDTISTAKAAIERKLGATVVTPVMPLDVFYLAEDYHQKYRLQHSPLMNRFNEMYSEFNDFNNSTAAARLNGFVSGHGSQQLFDDEYKAYGIPTDELTQAIRVHELSGRVARCSGDHCSIG